MKLLLYIVAAIIYALDQLCKWMIRAHLAVGQGHFIIPNVVEFYHLQNPGGAFSILPNWTWLFVFVAVVVIVAVVFIHRRFRLDRLAQVGLGLLLGGAVGNMTDRVVLPHHTVTDYVYFSIIHFPIFNLADASIDVGVILLLISSFRNNSATKAKDSEDVEQ